MPETWREHVSALSRSEAEVARRSRRSSLTTRSEQFDSDDLVTTSRSVQKRSGRQIRRAVLVSCGPLKTIVAALWSQ